MLTPWRRLRYTSWEIRPDRHAIGRRASSRRVSWMPKWWRLGEKLVKLSVGQFTMGCWILPRFIQLLKSPVAARVRRWVGWGVFWGVRMTEISWNFRIKYYKTLLHHFGYVFNSMLAKTGLTPLKSDFHSNHGPVEDENHRSSGFDLTTRPHKRPSKKMRREGGGRVLTFQSRKKWTKEPWIFGWLWMNASLLFTRRFIRKKP